MEMNIFIFYSGPRFLSSIVLFSAGIAWKFLLLKSFRVLSLLGTNEHTYFNNMVLPYY